MSPTRACWWALLTGTLLGLLACGAEGAGTQAAPTIGEAEQAFINGKDDRQEYFELGDSVDRKLMQQSIVALATDVAAQQLIRGDLATFPTWGEVNDLCPDEPFADQPSAAFCSGVLVDWDLVLTSGHCVDIVALSKLRVIFNYYFQQPGDLAVTRNDVYRVAEVIVARDDQSSSGERLDFGWLRLSQPVRSPHRPAPVRTQAPEVALGDSIIAINAGGGLPFKLDAGGRVRDLREGSNDYFVADTDTSEGSSGGAAFDDNLVLVGTLARGAPDFTTTSAGCVTSAREEDPRLAREQFTYADRSVAGLCGVEPDLWLCDSSCEEDGCEPPAVPVPLHDASDGCTLSVNSGSRTPASLTCVTALLAAALRRRQARRGQFAAANLAAVNVGASFARCATPRVAQFEA
jgi:hypothetical protein